MCSHSYTTTDIPTIISGPTIAFMEPQGKVWPGKAGRQYAITSPKMHSTLAPFDRVSGFSTGMTTYPHTLFRFPLRSHPSGLSEKCYDIPKLKELLDALKDDAEFLLIFLRSVVVVRVVEICMSGDHSTLFEVSISSCDRAMVSEKRHKFLRELKSCSPKSRKIPYSIFYEAKFHVTIEDEDTGESLERHWLVTAIVGSNDPQDLQAANKQNALPWVGCALELDKEIVHESDGRIFCFLPLPNETCSPLPVHVNGTFGLNDNRRTLKWPSKERKHDLTADWNVIIVKSLLPHCYALLIKNAIIEGLPADYVYSIWPQCNKLKRTPWSVLMQPLFDILFQSNSEVLWSSTSHANITDGRWVSLQNATILTSSEISDVVCEVLLACGLQIVDYSDHPQVQEAVRVANKSVTELSPSLARRFIRSKLKYQDLPSSTKYELLHYCLLDGRFNELEGLQLLPLANGSFVAFEQVTQDNYYYVCNDRHNADLLPGLQHQLVDVSHHNLSLHKELLKVASSNKCQLRKLNPEIVSCLLPQCMPPEWDNKSVVYTSGSVISSDWFERFWDWISKNNLDLFKDQMVLPVVKQCNPQSELCIARLVPIAKSTVIFVSENSSLDTDKSLMKGLEKFDVYFTGTLENLFPYLQYCKSLKEYVNATTREGILRALRNAYNSDEKLQSLRSITLTPKEAESIQRMLSDLHSQPKILMHLPIFKCVNDSTLHSIATAAHKSWKGKAVMITSSFECSRDLLPSNVVILCHTYDQNRLVELYKDMVDILDWVDFVQKYLFQLILTNNYPQCKVELLMKIILEQLPSLKPQQRDSLQGEIKNIPFLRKDSKGTLVPPCKLFDPSKRQLVNMLPSDLFPREPFCKPPLLHHLCECGLRQTVTAQEIVKLIHSISSKKPTSAAAYQAKAVLDYLESNKSLMDKKVQHEGRDNILLKSAIQDISKQKKWLPQQSVPPEYYPSCLGWKGKSFPTLVSLGPETLVCSPSGMRSGCLMVGSEACIVPCPASLSTVLRSSVSVEKVVKHFIEVIKYCDKLGETDTYNSIVEYIYEFLHKKGKFYNELKSSLPTHWIWIKKSHKFLSTKSVCLIHNPSLQHDLEPYIYILPESLQRFSSFFKAMGVKESITRSQLIKVLATIKSKDESDMNSEEARMTVMTILSSLTLHGKQPVELKSNEILYVPIKSERLQLEDSTKVCYADVDFLEEFISASENEDAYVLCHESIRYMAQQLHLTPLSEHLELSEDLFEDFGPHESLILRLKNILRDYTDGLTIVKELLQNADDAEATEINLCYDARQHSVNPKTLLYSGMNECSGPALVVHNDAEFTDDDFQNITRLAAATKKDKPLKIGKFGVGFCSVYHITDVPSFVSRQYLYIFDPTLQYLKEHVRDKSRPGKRLNFTKKIAMHSKQLKPFVGLNGFDMKTPFKGTMFRFPFRTSASEISPVMYTENHIKQLVQDIQDCGPKLLLFLRNVRRITFSRIDGADKNPRILLDISKESVPSLSYAEAEMIQIDTVHVYESNEAALSQQWLVGNYTKKIDFGGQERDALSSVACLMSSTELSDPEQFFVKHVHGEVFCFLPLPVKSGLPVHVSANFAVQNDRTGIRSSDDHSSCANEAEWNVDLMKHIIPKAYFNILLCLSKMHMKGVLQEEYKCYNLLPLKKNLTVHNPWDFLIQPLYSFACNNRILYSPFIKSWVTLSESMFLSPNILCNSQDGAQYVYECVQLLKLPAVDIPHEYELHLPAHISIEELDFVIIFFKRIIELQSNYKIRNGIIKLILDAYMHAETVKKAALEEILQTNECVPCSPNGELLKYCNDVIDPKAFFAGLYEPNDEVFPYKELQKFPHYQALIDLGMVSETLPMSRVAEQGRKVEGIYSSNDQCKALQRSRIILKCVAHLLHSTRYHVNPTEWKDLERIKAIPFIPVMQRPHNYPEFLSWQGDHHTLLAPNQIYYGEKCYHLAGSRVCVACTEDPESGGCGSIGRDIITKLRIKEKPEFANVAKHFRHIIEEVTSKQETCSSYNVEWVTKTCSEIYRFLEEFLRHGGILDVRELKNCVWTGSHFTSPNVVASAWPENGPYLYQVPSILADKKCLMAALKIKPEFSVNTFVETLEKISNEYMEGPVDKNCQDFLFILVTKLSLRMNEKVDWRKWKCYLPDSSLVMRRATYLDYNDAKGLNLEQSTGTYVHPNVPGDMAIKLGVRPIRAKMFGEYEDQYDGVEFGQSEDLPQRIKNILEDYPLDITLLKELLQNADDAKATKMFIILDKRTHGKKEVPSDEWRDLQGPSLLVWNDSTFREEDMTGIQKLGLGSKRSKSDTIGMYGIGFNVVYHLTDCPSFISTEKGGNSTLCILDPHCRYIPGAKRQKPGRRFNNLDQKFWMQWSDMASAYLQLQCDNLTDDIKCGSLFRFPLRHTQDLIEKSQLVTETSEPIDAQKMENYFTEWAPDMRKSLFFLNSVTELKFFVIDIDGNVSQTHRYMITIDDKGQQCRTRMQERVHCFSASNPTPHVETYTLTLTGKTMGLRESKPEKWLIQQGLGDIQKPTQHWHFLPRMKPKHGIAAPLCGSDHDMHVFCFLPLPTKSHLPVHINGSFALNSSRRQLWQPTTGCMDDKAMWNLHLIEAIASSYAHLLEKFKEKFISKDLLLPSIDQYYKTFPVWLTQYGRAPEGECLILAQLVYDNFQKKNASILVYLHETDEGLHHVKFLPLENTTEPWNQPYFYDRQRKELNAILRKIGMHLTEAPDVIYEHFAQRKRELNRVTQQSIFKYYSQFYYRSAELHVVKPSPISETKFGSVKDFKTFTECILVSTDDGYLKYPESPFDKPLLLTADGCLRKFDPKNKVIRTQFSDLFLESRHMFLHPEMMDVNYVKDYFLKPHSQCWDVTHSIFSNKLPVALRCDFVSLAHAHLTQNSLTKIWECLSKEEFFLTHLKKILETWALIPSKSKELFSLKCSYLPIMEDTAKPINPYMQPYCVQKQGTEIFRDIFRILGKLGMPQVDVTIVQEELAEKFSPKMSDVARVIHNLFNLHERRKVLDNITSDVSMIKPLLQYCCTFSLGVDGQLLSIIKALPLFKSIDGHYCSIKNGAYIWPKDMCTKGKELWLQECKCVFLDADGEWSSLNVFTLLGIKNVSSFKIYSTFIFPYFNKLQEHQRMCHLEVIRDSLYDDAENYTKVSYNIGGLESDARGFISCLKNLCFIPRSDGTLQTVSDFTDPRKKFFETFQHHFQFPPSTFKIDKWLNFLVKIGLRTSITTKEYLQFCQEVNLGKHPHLQTASEVLIDHLFQEKDWHKNTYFLDNVSKIPFVCAEPLPGVKWIHACAPPQNVVKHSDGTVNLTSLAKAADHEGYKLIWTVRPVVRLPSYPAEYSYDIARRKRKELLMSLKVSKVTPAEVINNIQNVSTTKFSDFQNFETYSCDRIPKGGIDLLEVLKANYEFLKDAAITADLSPLKDTACIPVCAEGRIDVVKRPVLVKPIQAIALTNDSLCEFMPFLNRLPSEFYSILPNILSQIGVEQVIMLKHIQSALVTIHKYTDQEMDVNSQCAVRKLIRKLYELLYNQPSSDEPIMLYLPNTTNVLVDSRTLLYQDSEHFRRTILQLDASRYSELYLLVSKREHSLHYRFQEKDLCNLLPSEIAPKPLSTSCREVMSSNCQPEATPSQLVKDLTRACKLTHLAAGACAILRHNSNLPHVCEKLKGSLEKFLKNCCIFSVKHLTVDLWLEVEQPAEHIGTAEVDFHIKKRSETTFHLYVDREARKILFFENLSTAILSFAADMCGVSIHSVRDPQAALTHLLKAESSNQIMSTLREFGISDYSMGGDDEFTEEFNPTLTPVLGNPLPESWHHRLQQDYNNVFRPGEWVGYEKEDDIIVFALIGYRIKEETDEYFARYSIYIEEGEQEENMIIVSVLEIYTKYVD